MVIRGFDEGIGPGDLKRPLHPWEERWFETRLPPPPARILITAAGAGREAAPLVARGYAVDAVEPGPRAVEACASRLGNAGEARVGTHEELNAAVLDGADNELSALASRRYDAVIIGWGSLSYVLDADERQRTVLASARLAPRGPVLASFVLREPGHMDPSQTRAFRLGQALGRFVGGGAPVDAGGAVPVYTVGAPVTLYLQREEIEAAGRAAGRSVIWEGENLHTRQVTLPPPSSSDG